MKTLNRFATPQLEKLHEGKVRDSFRVDASTRMIVVTDRISAFDSVLDSTIPGKGAVLNCLSNFWFEKTRHIVPNHVVKQVDPNITLVREAVPIRVEMIVRGYITGSMWRGYQAGKREFSGVVVPDGLTMNQRFPEPIVTPTTKEESDEEITPAGIVKAGLASRETYQALDSIARKLFKLGSGFLETKGFLMADTKYEFGLIGDTIVLIDEIHTPDSSRFWQKDDFDKDPTKVTQKDKEYVRQWLLANRDDKTGEIPGKLPEEVVLETTKRYTEMFKILTGETIDLNVPSGVRYRMYHNLVHEGLIKPGYVALVMGSPADLEHANEIAARIRKYGIRTDLRVMSAHKNGERIPELAAEYNYSIEPGVVIAIAGRSNGLGGALAANLNLPVINCPPFKDNLDMMVNINSSLVMPSKTPAATVVKPEAAAAFAIRALNLPHLRARVNAEIEAIKLELIEADAKVRGLSE